MRAILLLKVFRDSPLKVFEFDLPDSAVIKIDDGIHILTGRAAEEFAFEPSAVSAPSPISTDNLGSETTRGPLWPEQSGIEPAPDTGRSCSTKKDV